MDVGQFTRQPCNCTAQLHINQLAGSLTLKSFFLFSDLSVKAAKSENKSTASGAIYARSSVIFPHRMAFVRGRWMQ